MDFRFNGLLLLTVFLSADLLLCEEFIEDVPDVRVVLRAPSSKVKAKKDDELCKRQMALLSESYKSKELWALKVFDAWGKSQSGLFSGNLANFGHYEQCLAMKHAFDDPDDGLFEGQHCMVFFKDRPEGEVNPNATDFDNMFTPQAHHISLMRQYVNFYNVKLSTAMCVPTVCTPEMVRNIADGMLGFNSMKTTLDYNQDRFCNTINILEMRNIDMFAALFFSFMLLILILSTAYDLSMRSQNRRRKLLFSAFSVYTNGIKLFDTSSSKDIIECLHGIRAISILWVIHAHRVQAYGNYPIINRVQFRDQWMNCWSSVWATSANMALDTFFLLSGLLSARGMLKILDQRRKLNVGSLYIHRYLRITPVLAATIFCYMTLQRYFGDGPYNKQFVDNYAPNCQKYWFSALLHVQNIVNPFHLCLGHTWYLSPDFQLFLLSPLFVYPLWKFGWKFVFPIPVFALSSIAFIFIMSISYHFQVIPPYNTNEAYDAFHLHIYVSFYSHMCPYLTGILLAYVLHLKNDSKVKFPKHFSTGMWIASIVVIIAIVFGIHPFHSKENSPANWLHATFNSMTHLGWSMALSWIIFACHHGAGGFINSFLSLQVWKPLSRIGLSIYITHFLAQSAIFGTQKQPEYYNEFLKTHLFIGDIGLSFGVAVLAYLTFEAPILTIEKTLHSRDGKPTTVTESK